MLILPAAVPSMTPTVSSPSVSASPGGATHSNPLRSTNSTMVRKAARLFPSGNGWFLTRCHPKTATFVGFPSHRGAAHALHDGLRLQAAEGDGVVAGGGPLPGAEGVQEAVGVAVLHVGGTGDEDRLPEPAGMREGPFEPSQVPPGFDYETWLGQAPKVPFIKERTHMKFRYWWDYSAGTITDWGAHHNDIVLWATGNERSGPVSVEGKPLSEPIPGGFTVPNQTTPPITLTVGP